jgi:hypothetical protein
MESAMTENRKESWLELCALASVEQDPEKLLVLVAEIEHLLAADDPPEKPANRTLRDEGEKSNGNGYHAKGRSRFA